MRAALPSAAPAPAARKHQAPHLSLVLSRSSELRAEAGVYQAPQRLADAPAAWSRAAWSEVFEEWRWWLGAALALAVLGLAESWSVAGPSGAARASYDGWLLLLLADLFEGGPLLRCLLAAAASGSLIAVPWLWLRRARASAALREARRIERSLYAARKKWWPRS